MEDVEYENKEEAECKVRNNEEKEEEEEKKEIKIEE